MKKNNEAFINCGGNYEAAESRGHSRATQRGRFSALIVMWGKVEEVGNPLMSGEEINPEAHGSSHRSTLA